MNNFSLTHVFFLLQLCFFVCSFSFTFDCLVLCWILNDNDCSCLIFVLCMLNNNYYKYILMIMMTTKIWPVNLHLKSQNCLNYFYLQIKIAFKSREFSWTLENFTDLWLLCGRVCYHYISGVLVCSPQLFSNINIAIFCVKTMYKFCCGAKQSWLKISKCSTELTEQKSCEPGDFTNCLHSTY